MANAFLGARVPKETLDHLDKLAESMGITRTAALIQIIDNAEVQEEEDEGLHCWNKDCQLAVDQKNGRCPKHGPPEEWLRKNIPKFRFEEPPQPEVCFMCPRCLLECRDKPTASGCNSCRPIQVLKPIRSIRR